MKKRELDLYYKTLRKQKKREFRLKNDEIRELFYKSFFTKYTKIRHFDEDLSKFLNRSLIIKTFNWNSCVHVVVDYLDSVLKFRDLNVSCFLLDYGGFSNLFDGIKAFLDCWDEAVLLFEDFALVRECHCFSTNPHDYYLLKKKAD